MDVGMQCCLSAAHKLIDLYRPQHASAKPICPGLVPHFVHSPGYQDIYGNMMESSQTV
jgi:hypothetical protein